MRRETSQSSDEPWCVIRKHFSSGVRQDDAKRKNCFRDLIQVNAKVFVPKNLVSISHENLFRIQQKMSCEEWSMKTRHLLLKRWSSVKGMQLNKTNIIKGTKSFLKVPSLRASTRSFAFALLFVVLKTLIPFKHILLSCRITKLRTLKLRQ